MSDSLLRLIVRSLREADVTETYLVPDEQHGDDNNLSNVSVDSYKDADEIVMFEENPEDHIPSIDYITLADGTEAYIAEDFDVDAAKEALRNVKKAFKVTTDNGYYVYLSEKEYGALKPTKLLEFSYELPNYGDSYDVVVNVAAKTLAIGCQTFSISDWKRRGKSIIEENLSAGSDVAEAAFTALQAALPAIEERVERENPSPRRSRAKTAAGRRQSRAKTATGRRSRRRSSGRSRSR
jgi:hypothetical protein